jgi:hypothetical protein
VTTRRWRVLSALCAALVAAACSGGREPDRSATTSTEAEPRAITATEAERLAVVRFRNYDAGTRSVHAAYDDDGHDVELEGHFDYTTHTGYAIVSIDGTRSDAIVWDGRTVAIAPDDCDCRAGEPPSTVAGWTPGTLDATRSKLESLLAVLAMLGADRPENPLLLAESGAQWLRDDSVAGEPVTVFAGPPADGGSAGLRYWIDDTGLALRIEARLGDVWATIDLGDGVGVTIAPLPATQPGTRPGTQPP